jgi:hypothetical protein
VEASPDLRSHRGLQVLLAVLKIIEKFREVDTTTKNKECTALVRRLPSLVSDEYQDSLDEWLSTGDPTDNYADPNEFIERLIDRINCDDQELLNTFSERYFNFDHLFLF